MTPHRSVLFGHFAALACLFAAGGLAPAAAADASAWQGNTRASVRLVAGEALASAEQPVLRAGLEVKLASAWKTYWRYPGDSGVPPRFNFTRSENLKAATVLWPAPAVFEDAGGYSIGYKQRVIFPMRIVPEDPAQPVRLRVDFEYAICEKICIPSEAKLELNLDGRASTHEADLRQSEARVARRSALGEEGPLTIRAVRREPGTPEKVLVDLLAPPGVEVELFAEGPTPEWALPIPLSRSAGSGAWRTFVFGLEGLPPGATTKGAVLRLTAVAGSEAIEVETRLD